MINVDSSSLPPRLLDRLDKDDGLQDHPLAAPARSAKQVSDKMDKDARDVLPPLHDGPDANSPRVNLTNSASAGNIGDDANANGHNEPYSVSFRSSRHDDAHGPVHLDAGDSNGQRDQQHVPGTNSQDTSSTTDTDQVFTPPASEGGMSGGNGNGQDSSQESQLLHLSQLAAAQENMSQADVTVSPAAVLSRKRTADGAVKSTRERSSASPVRTKGHSRNTSTVSVASTTGSRIGELSAELKARLSYAMVKVNHGWQSHSIDQVECLASQGASPTSSTSTVHGRHGASASPRLHHASHRASNNSTPASITLHQFPSPMETPWLEQGQARGNSLLASPLAPSRAVPSLAPPVSIQPARQTTNTRRNSNPRHTPTFLSHSHHASPQTPGQPSPRQGTSHHRTMSTPVVDPILLSPHQNVREQDAIESLLFMSSPGNSANLKHTFPSSSSQPLPSMRNGFSAASSPQRTALPGSQPRKSLPSGRPNQQSQSLKRVGFEKSPSDLGDMDLDEPFGTPLTTASSFSRGTPKRRANGGHYGGPDGSTTRSKMPLSMPAGLGASSAFRPVLGEDEIDQMLDRAAAEDSSDSEGEIQIPVRRTGAGPVGT